MLIHVNRDAPPARPRGAGNTPHLAALDGLRAIAIAGVILVHVGVATGNAAGPDLLGGILTQGGVGVPIFFTLSGLLLYRPWAGAALGSAPNPSIRRYFRRRALRILPAYWLVFVVTLFTLNGGQATSPRIWAEYLTLTQNYDPHPPWTGTGITGLGPMWSLSVEASFYLVLPLIAAVFSRWARRGDPHVSVRAHRLLYAIGALAAASFALTAAIRFFAPLGLVFYWERLLPRSMIYFAAGMAIAVLCERAGQPGTTAARWVATVGAMPGSGWVLAVCGMVLAGTPLVTLPPGVPQGAWEYLMGMLLFPLVAVALVAPTAFRPRQPLTLAVLGNPVVRWVGMISYGLFLWHDVVLTGWYQVTGRPLFQHDMPLVLSVTITLSVAISAVSFYALERPAQRLRPLSRRA